MERLFDWIYPEEKRWALQVIQHTLALYAYVPVRIWDWNLSPKNPLSYSREQNWDDTIESGKGLGTMPPGLVKKYADRRSSYWLTVPCNILPLEEYLRTEKRWIAWGNFVIGKWLLSLDQERNAKKDCHHIGFFHKKMQMAACELRSSDPRKRYLVVGPIFQLPYEPIEQAVGSRPPSEKPTRKKSEFERLVDSFIKLAHAAFKRAERDTGVPVCLRKPDLKLLGGARSWIGDTCLERRPTMLRDSLEKIFDIRVHLEPSEVIRNSVFNNLTRHVLLLQTELKVGSTHIIDTNKIQKIAFDLHRPPGVVSLMAEKKKKSGADWQLALQKVDQPSEQGLGIWEIKGKSLTADDSSFKDVQWRRDEIRMALAHRYHGYATYRLAALSRWLSQQFDTDIQEGRERTDRDNFRQEGTGNGERDYIRKVSDQVLRLVNADVVTIYLCDHSKRRLKMLPPFFEKKHDHSVRTFWRRAEKLVMDEIAEQELRSRSIAYRALEEDEPQFVRAEIDYDANRKLTHPSFLNPTESHFRRAFEEVKFEEPDTYRELEFGDLPKFRRRSSMAFPLVVHGKKYGVMEIDGFCDHQFRFDNFVLALQATDIIGPFLYQRDLLSRLFRLNNAIMNPTTPQSQKYSMICREMASIFMAEASILFVPAQHDWQRLDLVGQHRLGLEVPIHRVDLRVEETGWRLNGCVGKNGEMFES